MLDLMSDLEVRELLGGISDKTLQRYRLNYWIPGVHYFCPVKKCQYNRPLIEDWIVNSEEPEVHNRTVEAWVTSRQGKQSRKQKPS